MYAQRLFLQFRMERLDAGTGFTVLCGKKGSIRNITANEKDFATKMSLSARIFHSFFR